MGLVKLYGCDTSPPVRACLLTLKALNLPFEYVKVDFLKKENLTKEYFAINPQRTIPALEDDGHFIWDSHAIMAYLVTKYGKDDSLYPKDLYQRAVVDQRLHFECGVMFANALRFISAPIFFNNVKIVPQSKLNNIIEIYEFLETFLQHNYIAGDKLTIADFSVISTVVTLDVYVHLEADKYPKFFAWIKRMERLPYYQETNAKGAHEFMDAIRAKNVTIG